MEQKPACSLSTAMLACREPSQQPCTCAVTATNHCSGAASHDSRSLPLRHSTKTGAVCSSCRGAVPPVMPPQNWQGAPARAHGTCLSMHAWNLTATAAAPAKGAGRPKRYPMGRARNHSGRIPYPHNSADQRLNHLGPGLPDRPAQATAAATTTTQACRTNKKTSRRPTPMHMQEDILPGHGMQQRAR